MDVAPDRGDVDEDHPRIHRLAHVVALHVPPGTAPVDLAVLPGQSTECNQQVAVLDDRWPARVAGEQRVEIAEDVRQDDLTGRKAVAVALERVPADAIEEAPKLTRCVVEATRARPPVGACEDGAVAVRPYHPLELARDEPARLVPGYGDESLRASLRAVRACTVLEPSLAYHGLRYAARVVEGVQHSFPDGGGVSVLLESVQRGQPAVAHLRAVRAPVGRGEGQIFRLHAHGMKRRDGFTVKLGSREILVGPRSGAQLRHDR